jgi:UDP-4-amino-4,6-dideoxy-N-acetyl-beta-L-altrosamine N-acetyltransferase
VDIQLTPIESGHLEIIRNWRNSPAVSQYMYTSEFITEEMQLKWYERIQNDTTRKDWFAFYNETPVGYASIYNINYVLQSCHFGIYIGAPEHRGAKIGSKIEYNILKTVFTTLGLNKLICEVFSTNNNMLLMQEKFGLKREGYFREHLHKDGQPIDIITLAILKKEWEASRECHYNRIYHDAI